MTNNYESLFDGGKPERGDAANLQEALSVDNIDLYRKQQWDNLTNYLIDGGYLAKGYDEGRSLYMATEVPKMNSEMLSRYGVEPAHDEHDTYSRLLESAKIDPFNEYGDVWNRPDDEGVTPRDRYQDKWNETFNNDSDVPEDEPAAPEAPAEDDPAEEQEDEKQPKTLEELQAEIDTLQGTVNTTFAKRMKVGVFRRKKKAALQSELEEQKAELEGLISQRNTALVDQLRSENLSDELIVEKLAEQANAEIEKQGKGQREAMIGNTFRGKMAQKFADLPRSGKIAATVLGSALTAGVVGLTAGSAGALGAGILVGTRISRTYAMNRAKLYETSTNPKLIEYKVNDEYRSIDDVLGDANKAGSKQIDERINKGDKIKRRAVIATLGSVGLIGAGLAAEHSDSIGAAAGWMKERAIDAKDDLGNWFSGSDTVDATPVPPTEPEGGGAGADADQQPDAGADSGADTPDQTTPDAVPNPGTVDLDQFADAVEISHGEGWYQTFGEMGISNPYDQQQLLNNDVLMAKLSNMGVAYVDPSLGGYGMNFGSGSMPPEALKLIHDTAVQSHIPVGR